VPGAHGGGDVRGRAAATQVAAHALANLVVRQLHGTMPHVAGGSARVTGRERVAQRGRAAGLAGRGIAALKCIVFDE